MRNAEIWTPFLNSTLTVVFWKTTILFLKPEYIVLIHSMLKENNLARNWKSKAYVKLLKTRITKEANQKQRFVLKNREIFLKIN